jgi:aspartate dehydrogenase
MKLGIIGCGAIGSDVAKAAETIDEIEKIYLFDIDKKAEQNLCKIIKIAEIKPVLDYLDEVDVVFEAASQQAVIEYAKSILKAGKDIIIMSVGSLVKI